MPIKLVNLEESSPMKQGIVTILRPDCELGSNKSAASIRRTLSADMSSKKWLSENGFFSTSSIKKNVSHEVLNNMNPCQDDVWKSIQSQKAKSDEMMQKPAVWGDILNTGKKKDCSSDQIYVHPLLKRSCTSLSEKSLEICTESLGSETGSDVYSNFGFSSDSEEDFKEIVMVAKDCELKEINQFEDLHVVKYKKSPVRPFPPPLPSIGGGNGAAPSLHMHSRRENGRLVVEAVSVPPRNNFSAQRSNGRLVLTLINKEKKVEEFKKVIDVEKAAAAAAESLGDDVAAAEKFMVEQNLRSLPSGMVMKKLMAFGNKNSTWSNKAVNVMAVAAKAAAKEAEIQIPHSLPPLSPVEKLIPQPMPTVSSFNPYEYFWRNKTTVSGGGFITTQQSTVHGGAKGRRNQDLVVVRGNKGDYYVGCKEQKLSLSFGEPYCIATS